MDIMYSTTDVNGTVVTTPIEIEEQNMLGNGSDVAEDNVVANESENYKNAKTIDTNRMVSSETDDTGPKNITNEYANDAPANTNVMTDMTHVARQKSINDETLGDKVTEGNILTCENGVTDGTGQIDITDDSENDIVTEETILSNENGTAGDTSLKIIADGNVNDTVIETNTFAKDNGEDIILTTRRQTKRKRETYKCDVCNFSTKNIRNLKQHLKKHRKKRIVHV